MERNKTLLRIFIAIALVFLTALLPFLTAFLQDLSTLGKAALGDNRTVELDFDSRASGLALLTLMDQGNSTRWQTIDPGAASMSMEEAEEAARAGMIPYQDAGLIPSAFPFEVHAAETKVISIPSGLAEVVWIFTFVAEETSGSFYEVNIAMDDASGRILNFGYGCEDVIPEQGMADKLKTFASVYFGQLGISGHEQAEVDDLAETFIGETAIAQRYRFGDAQYGESSVDLYMYQFGFFTDFTG